MWCRHRGILPGGQATSRQVSGLRGKLIPTIMDTLIDDEGQQILLVWIVKKKLRDANIQPEYANVRCGGVV